jgi:hypothetical protein
VRTLTLAVTIGALAAGCSYTSEPKSDYTLEEVRHRVGPTLYFVGEQFEELPLTAIVGRPWPLTFIYGDCDIPFGTEGGCAPPLEVQVWPIERRPPGAISEMLDCRRVTVRGALGAFYGSDLDLYVGDLTVVVFADSRERTLRAAAALRPVDAGNVTGDLPAPTIDPVPALARCSTR